MMWPSPMRRVAAARSLSAPLPGARAGFAPVVLALALVITAGCGPVFNLKPPAAFARFKSGDTNRWITADGVRLRVRQLDNSPKATLSFWTEALAGHLKRRGYVQKSKRCFKTSHQLPGCTLNHMLATGTGEWVMSTTVFVIDDRIVLVEAVGPWQRWKPYQAQLAEAVRQLAP